MGNRLLKFCFTAFAMTFVFGHSPAQAKPLNDAIIAIVNTDVITLKDLKDYIGGVYRQLKVENKSPQEIDQIMTTYQEKGVNQLIEDKLILAAAITKGLEVRSEIIDKQLKTIKERYPSEDDFLASLNSQGITVSDIKAKLLNQLKTKYMVDLEVRDKIFVNPEDVTRFYNQHQADFQSKTRYNLDSIYISFDKGRAEAIKRVNEAREKLVQGAEFAEVSKEYSQAPSVGMLEAGQMVPAIEREVFSLKQGEISQPVTVEGGVYLFVVTGISEGRIQTLPEVKSAIYNRLYDQQFQAKFNTWLDKLRKKAYIEIRS